MQVEATRLFRVRAVAEICAVHPATIYRAVEAGRLAALRFGAGNGGLRISAEALNAYLAASRVTTGQADGLACVVCQADYLRVATPHVPVGRSHTGSQVFACSHHTAEQIHQATTDLGTATSAATSGTGHDTAREV
jgi:excisionase family DNA binding protein